MQAHNTRDPYIHIHIQIHIHIPIHIHLHMHMHTSIHIHTPYPPIGTAVAGKAQEEDAGTHHVHTEAPSTARVTTAIHEHRMSTTGQYLTPSGKASCRQWGGYLRSVPMSGMR